MFSNNLDSYNIRIRLATVLCSIVLILIVFGIFPAVGLAADGDEGEDEDEEAVKIATASLITGYTPEVVREVSNITGLATESLTLDYSPEYVVSPVMTRGRDGSGVTYYLMHSRSEDVLPTLNTMFSREISDNTVRIGDNPWTNAIFIRTNNASDPVMEQIIETISSMDFQQGQVLIDVLVVELKVNNKDLFDFEMKNLVADPLNIGQTQITTSIDNSNIELAKPTSMTSGFKTLVTSQNRLKLFLNAAKTLDRLNVVSSPHIMAVNHRPATFKIGDKVPIISSIRPSDAGPIKTFEIKEIGIELTVTPHINRNSQILMEVFQTINNLSSYNEKEGTAQMTNREVKTNIIVGNGETLILGGFIEDKHTIYENRVPVLSNIPILGKLFRQKDKRENKTELLVFLTPRIIMTKEGGKDLSKFHVSRLSFKKDVEKILEHRNYQPPQLSGNQEIIIDRYSRNWRYDFGSPQVEILVWQIPPEIDTRLLKMNRVGSCPFGYGPSKRLAAPFIRTYLTPSEGFIFQKEFLVNEPERYRFLTLNVASTNAAAVYINGKMVDEDPAIKLRDGHDYEYWNRSSSDIPGSVLKPGVNVITVMLGNDSSAISAYFDMMLIGNN